MELVLLSREEIVSNWVYLQNQFQRALSHGQGESTAVDYLQKLLNYQAQAWVIKDNSVFTGAVLTEILNYTRHKTLHIIVFSGEGFENQHRMFLTLENFARDNNCSALEAWGRSGWSKVLPKYIPEMREVYRVFRKDLQRQGE